MHGSRWQGLETDVATDGELCTTGKPAWNRRAPALRHAPRQPLTLLGDMAAALKDFDTAIDLDPAYDLLRRVPASFHRDVLLCPPSRAKGLSSTAVPFQGVRSVHGAPVVRVVPRPRAEEENALRVELVSDAFHHRLDDGIDIR